MKVRKDRAEEYRLASGSAIDAIASDGFRQQLQWFITHHAATGDHAGAWAGVDDAGTIVAGLLEGIKGVTVDTMNDAMGAWYLLFHNKALEGAGDGPILVNPFYKGDRADYANTIAHEAAHRYPVQLKHPSYGRDADIGECEPPYVIGSLVEKQVQGSGWKWTKLDCVALKEIP